MSTAKNTTAARNTSVIRKAAEAFKRGDIDTLLQAFSKNAKLHVDTPPYFKRARTYKGREGIARHFAELAKREKTLAFEVESYIAQGNQVVVIYSYRGKVLDTGKIYGLEAAHAFKLKNGEIYEAREYHDTVAEAAAYAK